MARRNASADSVCVRVWPLAGQLTCTKYSSRLNLKLPSWKLRYPVRLFAAEAFTAGSWLTHLQTMTSARPPMVRDLPQAGYSGGPPYNRLDIKTVTRGETREYRP